MVQSDNRQQGVLRSLDWWTIGIYLALLTFGWISVCGASYTYGDNDIFSLGSRSGMQIIWIATSITLGFVILLLDDRFYDTFSYVIYAALVLLLFATIFNPHSIKDPVRGLYLDLCVCSQPSLPSLLRLLPFPSLCRVMASISIA